MDKYIVAYEDKGIFSTIKSDRMKHAVRAITGGNAMGNAYSSPNSSTGKVKSTCDGKPTPCRKRKMRMV